jgi:hypothetical protein
MSSLTSSGLVTPKAAKLFAIWRICFAECVRALLAYPVNADTRYM